MNYFRDLAFFSAVHIINSFLSIFFFSVGRGLALGARDEVIEVSDDEDIGIERNGE